MDVHVECSSSTLPQARLDDDNDNSATDVGDVSVNLDFSDNLSASILNRINIGAELAGI